jgi:hypothetical protein
MNRGVLEVYRPVDQFIALMWCCTRAGGGWVDAVYPVQPMLLEARKQARLRELYLFAEGHGIIELG